MNLPVPTLLVLALAGLVANTASEAHSGGLDGNGCHYEGAPGSNYHCHRDVAANADQEAPVKKSRENICHDRNSPNYRSTRYFIAFPSVGACLRSGGRKPLH